MHMLLQFYKIFNRKSNYFINFIKLINFYKKKNLNNQISTIYLIIYYY